MTTSLPICATCGGLASSAIFLPDLAGAEYVVAVCRRHDLMGDGERYSLDAMAANAPSFLAAFDKQQVDDQDDRMRGWLVEQANGGDGSSDLLTVFEAAAETKTHPETIRRRVRKGELKALPRTGRAPIRIERNELYKQPTPKRRATPKPADVIGRRRSSSVAWPK